MEQFVFLNIKEIEMLSHIKREFSKKDKDRYLAEIKPLFILSSLQLSGLNLSLPDVKNVIAGMHLDGHHKDVLLTHNMSLCYDLVFSHKGEMTSAFILRMHSTLFKDINPDAGRWREIDTEIYGSGYMPPGYEIIDMEVDKLCGWASVNKGMHPLELASVLHLRFAALHPFMDGNGRIARFLLNFILWKHGWPLFSIGMKHKKRYISSLEKSHLDGNDEHFFLFALEEYLSQ